jgi:hypothetical protein
LIACAKPWVRIWRQVERKLDGHCSGNLDDLFGDDAVEPMARGHPARLVQIGALPDAFNALPPDVARLGAGKLRDATFPRLIDQMPSLTEQRTWNA